MSGLVGLDVGCGEAHNTRLLAERGARMVSLDLSHRFIEAARDREQEGAPSTS